MQWGTSLRCLVARKRIMTSVFLAHTWFFFSVLEAGNTFSSDLT